MESFIYENTAYFIFDEIQDCPQVTNSLRYFCENAPQYHVACAGSLLGIALAKPSSFPVGKVNLQIDPMTFTEFPKISMIWKCIPSQLAPTAFGEGNRLFTEFKGTLTENYVFQTLLTQFEVVPRYWSQNNPPYEVDFIIQRDNEIFPVEVKAENNIKSRSLKKI